MRPKEWAWKWGGPILYDSFWIGDVPAGVQCELRGASYCGPMLNLYRPEPPVAWSNAGRGGCTLSEEGETVLLRAYCGPRRIEPQSPLRFEFALLPTPVKPLDTAAHFRERYYHAYDSVATAARAGANVINIHHATPLNPYINYPFLATEKLRAYVKAAHARGMKLKIYYTVRELTNHVTEMWALRSLGHEVLAAGPGGGYPWLREHLVADYAPAWYDNLAWPNRLTWPGRSTGRRGQRGARDQRGLALVQLLRRGAAVAGGERRDRRPLPGRRELRPGDAQADAAGDGPAARLPDRLALVRGLFAPAGQPVHGVLPLSSTACGSARCSTTTSRPTTG